MVAPECCDYPRVFVVVAASSSCALMVGSDQALADGPDFRSEQHAIAPESGIADKAIASRKFAGDRIATQEHFERFIGHGDQRRGGLEIVGGSDREREAWRTASVPAM